MDEKDLILELGLELTQAKKDLNQFYKEIKQQSKDVYVSPIIDAKSLTDYDIKLKQSTKQAKADREALNKSTEEALKNNVKLIEEEIRLAKETKATNNEIIKQKSYINSLEEKYAKQKQSISNSNAKKEQDELIKQKQYLNNLETAYAKQQQAEKIRLDRIANQERIRNERIANQEALRQAKQLARDKAKAEADAKRAYDKTFIGAINDGTTFGHKFATTAQYATAGAGLYAMTTATREFTRAVIDSDSAVTKFQAILYADVKNKDQAVLKSKALQQEVINIGKAYGDNVNELSNAVLDLGRAGVPAEELSQSLKSVSQIAKLSGENLQVVTDVFITWRTIYPNKPVAELADSLVGVANASKLSVDSLKTASGYIVSAGQQAGLTANAVMAIAGAYEQVGRSASQVGTEGRRFMEQMTRPTDNVREAYRKLGIDVDKVAAGMMKGGKEAEDTLVEFYRVLSTKSKTETQNAIKGVTEVLDAQTIQTNIQVANAKVGFEKLIQSAGESSKGLAESQSKVIADSYESIIGKIKASFIEVAIAFENGLANGSITADEFNAKFKEFSDSMVELASTLGEGLGVIVRNFDVIVKALIAYKAISIGSSVATKIFSSSLYVASMEATTLASRMLLAEVAIRKAGTAMNVFSKSNIIGIVLSVGAYFLADWLLFDKKVNETKDTIKDIGREAAKSREEALKTSISATESWIKNVGKNLSSDNPALIRQQQILKDLKKELYDIQHPKKTNDKIDLGGGVKVYDKTLELANEKSKIELLKEQNSKLGEAKTITRELNDSEKERLADAKLRYDLSVKENDNAIKLAKGDDVELIKARAKSKMIEQEINYKQTIISLNDKSDTITKDEYTLQKKILEHKEKSISYMEDSIDKEEQVYKITKEKLELEKKFSTDIDKNKQIDEEVKALEKSYSIKKRLRDEEHTLELSRLNKTIEGRLDTQRLMYEKEYDMLVKAGYSKEQAESLARERSKSEWDNYIDSLKDGYGGLQNVAMNAFGNMEDAMVEAAKTGKLDFHNMANAIMEDLLKMTIRMQITANLARSLGGYFGTPSVGGSEGVVDYTGTTGSAMNSWTGSINDNGKLSRFASGYIAGNGYASYDSLANDTIPAMISKGEAVIPASVVNKNRGLIEALISSRTNKFATGYINNSSNNNPLKQDVKVEVINKGGQQLQANDVKITQSEQAGMIVSIVVDDIKRGGAIASAIRS